MAGSSTAELRLRPTGEDDLDYVVAAEAATDPRQRHLIAEEGTLRDALYHGGRFESLVVMSLLRPEWSS